MWVFLAIFFAQSVDFSAEGQKALDAQKYDAAVELLNALIWSLAPPSAPRMVVAASRL